MLAIIIAVALASRFFRVPYTVGLALAGLAVGEFYRAAPIGLTPDVVLLVFLPPPLFGSLDDVSGRITPQAFGVGFGSYVLAGALGVFVMGAGFDTTRSYAAPLGGFFVAMLLAILLIARLGPYRYLARKTSVSAALTNLAGDKI
ncbi:MAG: hypothetical protein GIW99_02735 [Candidatus Eremiobacteraeota bacterium]|nr:hypothetical protein [Candidatus Eremiobacteraeota bacterium]MBC5826591.1 hypothetical protein [Candidatus Eremiobacteraeota bacterium]